MSPSSSHFGIGMLFDSNILTFGVMGITFCFNSITEAAMPTTVTVKGQVTLPKAVREAAGIRPGDKVEVRALANGGVIIERPASALNDSEYAEVLRDMIRRKPLKGKTAEEILAETRSEVW